MLAGCVPGVAEYSKSEAPNRLQVDGATSEVALPSPRVRPGSTAGEAVRLDRLVANGRIRQADRVAIAASGPPALAEARSAAISSRLLRWGIVAEARPLPAVPPNRAVVTVGRYAVTLPACPNWSMQPASDFTNAPTSNFGCATAVEFRPDGGEPGRSRQWPPAGGGGRQAGGGRRHRYLDDKVQLPTGNRFGTDSGSSGGSGATPGATSGTGGQ